MSSIIEISLKAKNNPTVNIIVNEAGSVTSTGSVSPVINFVATGEQGPTGAQGEQGTVSGTDVISQQNIGPSAVGTNELENNSVTNAKLGTNSVYGTVIPDYAITNSKIGPDAITPDKIADNAVTADHIAPNAITEELIEAGVITSDSIALNTITSGNIQNYTLVNTDYARNSVDGAVIVDNPEITGNISAVNYKAVGASPGTFEGPDDDEMHLKFHTDLKFVNSSGQIIGSIDQNGNLTISGTVDGVDIGTSVTANNAKVGITTAQANAIIANTAKETNETTDLSVTASSTFLRIESSDGADVLLPPATANSWGVMSDEDKAKLDGIEAGATADQTTEEIQDIVGDVVATGGTKTGIAITYDDANNNMDFVVDHDAATNFVAEEHYRWDNDIQSTATINHVNLSSDTPGETEVLVINDGDAVWGHGEKIHIQVRNDEGVTIPAGAPLYSKGEIGGSNRILVGICDANDASKMPCIGIAHSEMNTTDTKDNFAVVSGIYNTNLSGFTSLAVGDNLYIQDDGSLSQTKPTGESSLVQNVGIVLRTNGTICQGLLVSAIGRTNDVPNLNSGNIFLGNASNLPQATTIAAAIEGAGNITIDGDLILDDDVIKGSSGNVILSSASDIVKTPLGLFTNSISGYDNADFELKAGGNVQFTLDVDNNETAQSFSFRDGGAFGSFTEIANLDQSGNLQINGDLTVSGNEIKDDDGTTCITFDSSGNTTIANTLNANVTGDLTGNASTATALTAGNKTLDGNLTIDTGHSLTVPFLNTYQINAPSGTDNDLLVTSNGDIKFTLDNNTNETGQSFTFRNHDGYGNYTDLLNLNESGDLIVYGSSLGDPKIKLQQNTNSGTSGPPILEFYRDASAQDNSDLGLIQFRGRNNVGNERTYAEIHGICEESGSGIEGGKIEFKVASHDAELVTGLKIEDGDAEDEVDVTLGNGGASSVYIPGALSAMGASYFGSAPLFSTGLDIGSNDTTLTRTAAGEVSIEGNKIITENYVKHVLNCGWFGGSTSRVYLPFGYGGTFESTSSSGYLEYGAFIAPCNGTVDFVAIRSEEACGNSNVGIHIATNGTEMPGFNPGTYLSPTVNMSADDTSYKFDSFTDQGGSSPSFNAGDVIVVSFDPTNISNDTVATMVLNLDWTNAL